MTSVCPYGCPLQATPASAFDRHNDRDSSHEEACANDHRSNLFTASAYHICLERVDGSLQRATSGLSCSQGDSPRWQPECDSMELNPEQGPRRPGSYQAAATLSQISMQVEWQEVSNYQASYDAATALLQLTQDNAFSIEDGDLVPLPSSQREETSSQQLSHFYLQLHPRLDSSRIDADEHHDELVAQRAKALEMIAEVAQRFLQQLEVSDPLAVDEGQRSTETHLEAAHEDLTLSQVGIPAELPPQIEGQTFSSSTFINWSQSASQREPLQDLTQDLDHLIFSTNALVHDDQDTMSSQLTPTRTRGRRPRFNHRTHERIPSGQVDLDASLGEDGPHDHTTIQNQSLPSRKRRRVDSSGSEAEAQVELEEPSITADLQGLATPAFPNRSPLKTRDVARFFRVLEEMQSALLDQRIITKRDLYYRAPTLFGSQAIVDRLVDKIAQEMGLRRSALGVVAASKGLVAGFGQVDNTAAISLSLVEAGDFIEDVTEWSPTRETLVPDLDSIRSIQTTAGWILVAEKEAVFKTLLIASFCSDVDGRIGSRGLLVTGKGFPDLMTKDFVAKLSQRFPELPIMVLVDHDPYGLHIAHIYQQAVSPRPLHFIGLSAEDLQETDLPLRPEDILDLTAGDRKRCDNLLQRPELSARLRGEVEAIKSSGKKAELESLSNAARAQRQDRIAAGDDEELDADAEDGLVTWLRCKLIEELNKVQQASMATISSTMSEEDIDDHLDL